MGHMQELLTRANNHCELCQNNSALSIFNLDPKTPTQDESALVVCSTCKAQIEKPSKFDAKHWQCLNEAIWSEYSPVKIMAYHILHFLKQESWAQELLEQLYLTDEELKFAKENPVLEHEEEINKTDDNTTYDSNKTKLADGDSVTLIKDLEVKGANFTAKRGTLVKNIRLTANPKHIEGKVNGTQIVIIAEYVKKSN